MVFATLAALQSFLVMSALYNKMTGLQDVWSPRGSITSMCIMHQRQPSPQHLPALYSLQNAWTLPAVLTERGASRLLQAEPAGCDGERIARMLDILVMPSLTLLGHHCSRHEMQKYTAEPTACTWF